MVGMAPIAEDAAMIEQASDIVAIDGACRILGNDKVQVYLLAGLSVASIVAHANSVAKAKIEAEAVKAQTSLDAETRSLAQDQGATARVARLAPMTPPKPICKTCNGCGWLCDGAHEPRPWADQPGSGPNACGCGAGKPCPECNELSKERRDVDA